MWGMNEYGETVWAREWAESIWTTSTSATTGGTFDSKWTELVDFALTCEPKKKCIFDEA